MNPKYTITISGDDFDTFAIDVVDYTIGDHFLCMSLPNNGMKYFAIRLITEITIADMNVKE